MPKRSDMSRSYVHGYRTREHERLQDQAGTPIEILHGDTPYPPGRRGVEAAGEVLHGHTHFPPGSPVLEAGGGVGAQTVALGRRSPRAFFTSVDISPDS